MSIFLFACSNVFPISPWSCSCVVEPPRAFIPLLSYAFEIQALSQTYFVFCAYFRLKPIKKAFQIAHHNLPSKCLIAVFYSHVSHSSVGFFMQRNEGGPFVSGVKTTLSTEHKMILPAACCVFSVHMAHTEPCILHET